MDHTHGRFWPQRATQSSHYCGDHLSDYFELEGTLRHTNDQFIEGCHAMQKLKSSLKTIQITTTRTNLVKNMARLSWQQSYNSTVITLAVYNKSIVCVCSKSQNHDLFCHTFHMQYIFSSIQKVKVGSFKNLLSLFRQKRKDFKY